MSTPKIVTGIICDDVRIESNNKHILIGVYHNDILVSEIPTTIWLTLWMRMIDIDAEQLDYEFFSFLGSKRKFRGEFTISPPSESGGATVVLGPFALKVDQEGDFKINIRSRGERRWRNAAKVPIRILSPVGV